MTHVSSEGAVLAVADGCSSGPSTEVGATLGATWLARNALRYAVDAELAASPAACVARIEADLLAYLRSVAIALCPSADDWSRTIHDVFLFSFLAAIVTGETALLIGAGDGVYAIDGDETILDAGPENAPRYLAYALVEAPSATHITLHAVRATRDLRSILLATDGAIPLTRKAGEANGELDDLARDSRYAKNPSLLRKRLVVLGALERRLHDDTAIALLTRRGA